MKILLDTHAVIWSLTNDPQLSTEAKEMILKPENLIIVSAASLWEIAIKSQKSHALCPYHEKDIKQFCELSGYELLPVRPSHILQLRSLRIKPGCTLSNMDPFDRILLSQAKEEGALFLTHDRAFSFYDESVIRMI